MTATSRVDRRRIAVIGGGISGLTTAYILRREADVTLYEANSCAGGHANTVEVSTGNSKVHLDSGFITYSPSTYPTLQRMFDELNVKTQPTRLSLAVRCDGCGLEYAGARGLRGLIASPRLIFARRYIALLAQVPRFNRLALNLRREGLDSADPSLGEFLKAGSFSDYFAQHYVNPLIAGGWSCATDLVAEYPARYLFPFMEAHALLSVGRTAGWRTVSGGSRQYVDKIISRVSDIRLETAVRSVRRHADGVIIRDEADRVHEYDAVVIAAHADQSLALLEDPSADETSVLGAFSYSRNEVTLHTDSSLMPRNPRARGSWSYFSRTCSPSPGDAVISYHLNELHALEETDEYYLVTLNGSAHIEPEKVIKTFSYEHPLYTTSSVSAQKRLGELSSRSTAFAGGYHGWGFHEDGCRSGVEAARALGFEWM